MSLTLPRSTNIMGSDPDNPWRKALIPAKFRDAPFFVETSAKSSGRRIVEHEFPKKDVPYAEDMGRHNFKVAIRAYVIQYPSNTHTAANNPAYPLLQRDYRLARDRLEARLLEGQYGLLQLPSPPSSEASLNWQAFTVACDSYQLREEERYGGYAVFDINFVEAGSLPNQPSDAQTQLNNSIDDFKNQIQTQMGTPNQRVQDAFGAIGSGGGGGGGGSRGQNRFNRGQARLRFGP